jgi:hypothetical protein
MFVVVMFVLVLVGVAMPVLVGVAVLVLVGVAVLVLVGMAVLVLVGMAVLVLAAAVLAVSDPAVDVKFHALDFLPLLAVVVHVEIAEVKFAKLPFQGTGFDTEVDEGADHHVAADAGDAVEIECFHGIWNVSREYEARRKTSMPKVKIKWGRRWVARSWSVPEKSEKHESSFPLSCFS